MQEQFGTTWYQCYFHEQSALAPPKILNKSTAAGVYNLPSSVFFGDCTLSASRIFVYHFYRRKFIIKLHHSSVYYLLHENTIKGYFSSCLYPFNICIHKGIHCTTFRTNLGKRFINTKANQILLILNNPTSYLQVYNKINLLTRLTQTFCNSHVFSLRKLLFSYFNQALAPSRSPDLSMYFLCY